MKRQRRLRRLVPDSDLFRRRATGETLRALACDYHVEHTTLSRYFTRPEARRQLRQAGQLLRAERSRPLRRLVPDPELFRRRAAGADELDLLVGERLRGDAHDVHRPDQFGIDNDGNAE